MGLSSTPYGTQQDYIPGISKAERWKFGGIGAIRFDDIAALKVAIAKEVAIAVNGDRQWPDRQEFTLDTEPGVIRVWSLANGHARSIRMGETYFTLAGDDNTVISAINNVAPVSGVGADGDRAFDVINNAGYVKTAGAWVATGKVFEYTNSANVYVKLNSDGTDQGPAINAAIAALYVTTGNRGGTIHFPAGDFKIGTPIEQFGAVALRGVNMPGASGGGIGTRLQALTTSASILRQVGPAINNHRLNTSVDRIGFRGVASGTMTAPLVQMDNISYSRFMHCTFGTTANRAVWMRGAWDCRFTDCSFDFCGDAAGSYPVVDLDSPVGGAFEYTNQVFFAQCRWESTPGVAVQASGANTNEIFFTDCKIESGAPASILPLLRATNCTNLSFNNLQVTGQLASGKAVASLVELNNCTMVHGRVTMENAGLTSGGTIATYMKIVNSRAVILDLGIVGGQAAPTSGKLVDWDGNNASSIAINYMGGLTTTVGAPNRSPRNADDLMLADGTKSVEDALTALTTAIEDIEVPGGTAKKNPRRPSSCFNRPPNVSAAYSRTCWNEKQIYVAPMGADFSENEITWCGFQVAGAEVANISDFTLEATIEINGVIYDLEFEDGTLIHTFLAGTTTVQKTIIRGFTGSLTGGMAYWLRVRRTAASGARWLITNQINPDDDSGQWSYNGSDLSVNYLHGGEPKGFRARPALVLQGDGTYSISSVNVVDGGTGYPNGATTLRAYDPDNGRQAVIQSRTATGGVVATGNSGSGMSNNTGWGINTTISAAAIGTVTEVYRPMLISGIPSAPLNAWLWQMASTAVGYGGGDTSGDSIGAYGPLERALGRSVGIINMSVPAQNFQIWVNNSYWPVLNSVYDPVSGSIANYYAGDLTNDCGNVANTAQTLTGLIISAYNYRKPRGYVFTMATPTTRTTGPHVGAYRQPVASGFGPGTPWEVITDAIRRPTRMNAMSPMMELPCIDWARGMSDADNQFAWRSDQMLFGPYSTLARLKLAYTAGHFPGAVAVVGTPGAYALYDIVSGAWSLRATPHLGVFANDTALETAFPAASNSGGAALVGPADGPWVLWDSDGTAWYKHAIAMTNDGSHTNINLQRRAAEFLRPFIPDINAATYYKDTRRQFNRSN